MLKKTISTKKCSRPLPSGNKEMPKRGDIQCIGHWDQENGSKVRFSMYWTFLVDQKFNIFEFLLNIHLFSPPQESCISYNSGVPAEMEMRFTRFDIRTYLQLELTLNQLMRTCKSKSNLLTITCPIRIKVKP